MHLINWAEAKKAMEAGEGIARKGWEQETENTISFILSALRTHCKQLL